MRLSLEPRLRLSLNCTVCETPLDDDCGFEASFDIARPGWRPDVPLADVKACPKCGKWVPRGRVLKAVGAKAIGRAMARGFRDGVGGEPRRKYKCEEQQAAYDGGYERGAGITGE